MNRPSHAAAGIASAALAIGALGCGGSSSSNAAPEPAKTQATAPAKTTKQATPARPAAAKPTGKQVKVAASNYGRILFDGRGKALYLFTHDSAKSRCYGACASAWPPFLTKGQPRATGAAKQSLLGTVKRSDGSTQVTYKGQPLYYYIGDRSPGQVGCQAALEYGGYWYVVKPDGGAVR